ncbi:hypothetical protein NEIMUCOT_04259 [Neisseria mucosa ATCC 25996]|uniref:Uncharacterized protein n=1 Tax=Neisseria mucosa (strain ATCC 25996 / DSM 4631 / NCTC 10774 / M26) TaxID=546266 RepID=D2ZUH1_NEIM2|nr:hypothetical protein NEIMUCOT_04259 [Neisseria mucosa ATCC 25996]
MGEENSRKPVLGLRLSGEGLFCKGLRSVFFVVGLVCDEGVFAMAGHDFGLEVFECADAAFLIGCYPTQQVGS